MHTMKQTISLKSPRDWQEMGFPGWQRHTWRRRMEHRKHVKGGVSTKWRCLHPKAMDGGMPTSATSPCLELGEKG